MTTYKSQMIQFRAGDIELTEAQWTANQNVYAEGIIAITTDGANAGKTKVFDGVSYWSQLAYTNGGGGSTSPGGTDGQVQFNNAGSFDGKDFQDFEPTEFIVATSGSVSGVYRNTGVDGQVPGRKVWALVGGDPDGDIIAAISSGGGVFLEWRWLVGGVLVYTSSDDVSDPSLVTTWELSSGEAPLPSTKKYTGTLQEVLEELAEAVNTPKEYVFIANQSGTNAPVVTVLKNTLGGDVVWTYNGTGNYIGTLEGAFPADKTIVITPSAATGLGIGNAAYLDLSRNSNDEILLNTTDGGSQSNDMLNNTGFKIEVYP